MKYVSIDVETTGTHPYRDQIIEFGAVIDDLENPQSLSELPKFQCIIPYESYRGTAIALNMNQDIIKILAEFDKIKGNDDKKKFMKQNNMIYPNELAYYFANFLVENNYIPKYEDLSSGLDTLKSIEHSNTNIITAGKNFINFDKKFIENHFVIYPGTYINGVNSISSYLKFNSRCLDPVSMYTRYDDKQLPDSKTCRERAGLSEIENSHQAVQDSLDVIQMVRKRILGYVE